MKIGLNTWTVTGFRYRGVPGLKEILKIASEAGYDGVEFTFDANLLHPDKITREIRRELLETAKSYNLVFPSVATGVFWRYNLGSPDESVRKTGEEFVIKGLELARDLKARVLLVVPAVAKPEIPYDKLYETSVKTLKKLSKKAEDVGVIIGVENVWNKFLYSPLEFRRFLEDIGSEYVKAYFDVGNVVNLGYIENWIDLIGDLIAMVHVKDFDVNVGNIYGFRHVGRGSIDWKMVITKLKEVGYDDFLNAECPPEFYPGLKEPKIPEDGIRAARDNAKALREIFEKYY